MNLLKHAPSTKGVRLSHQDRCIDRDQRSRVQSDVPDRSADRMQSRKVRCSKKGSRDLEQRESESLDLNTKKAIRGKNSPPSLLFANVSVTLKYISLSLQCKRDNHFTLGTIHKGRPQNFWDFGPPPPPCPHFG